MLESLGNAGDFIGGLGVVLTLLYLAIQIRQNSQAVKAAAAESVLMALSEAFRGVAQSPSLSKAIAIGLSKPEKLDETEVAQFFLWLLAWFRLVEQAHAHYILGNIPEGSWQGQVAHCKTSLFSPMGQQFWALRRDAFSPDFQSFVDSLSPDGATPRIDSKMFMDRLSSVQQTE